MEAETANPGQSPTPEGEAPLSRAKETKPRPARKRTRKVKGPGGVLVVPRPKLSSGKFVKPEENLERKKQVVAEWTALRALNPKISVREGAERLSISQNTLWNYIKQGTKEGWLKFDDPMDRLEHEIIPGVVDNLAGFIAAKDRTVTIEAAKGTIFKVYQERMGISDSSQRPVLSLNIEIVTPDSKPLNVIEGQIIGKPKELTDGS